MSEIQGNLFDGEESERRKRDGMERGAENRVSALELARQIAREICRHKGSTHADEVGLVLWRRHGIKTLGPAAGSIFKTGEFVCTGERVQSTRKSNHSRELRVWRLK